MVARRWAARVQGLSRHERMIADSADHRLLTIAEEHVRRFGVDRLTVVAVAREAGMTHANVYRYFPSKSALADAVSAQWLRALDALLTDAAGSPDPADDKLERMMVALAAALRDRAEVEPNLFRLFAEAFSEGRDVARRHRSRVRLLVERVVEEGIGAGTFPVKSRERASALVFDAAYRFVTPQPVETDRETSRKIWDQRALAAIGAAIRALKAGAV